MKNHFFIFLIAILTFQSCAHIAVYVEDDIKADDAWYSSTPMHFAFKGNGNAINAKLQNIGNAIYKDAQRDAHFNDYLPSALYYCGKKADFNKLKADAEEFIRVNKDTKYSGPSRQVKQDYEPIVRQAKKYIEDLSNISNEDCSDLWFSVYKLSHRNILHRYAVNNSRFNALSKKNKELVYGYVLQLDVAECEKLANAKVEKEAEEIRSLKVRVGWLIDSADTQIRLSEKKEAEAKREEEARKEKIRQQQLAEKRAKEEQAARLAEAQAAQEAAQRLADYSWIDGHWQLRTDYGITNIYINASKETITVYYMRPYGLTREKTYQGKYEVQDGKRWGKPGYLVIHYGDTVILADPYTGGLYDTSGEPIDYVGER